MEKLHDFFCNTTSTINDAISIINQGGFLIAFVVDNNQKLIGTVTDGDIRRAIIQGKSTSTPLIDIMNGKPLYVYESNKSHAENLIREKGIKQVPVLSSDQKVLDVISWKDIFNFKEKHKRDNKVFMLVGGKGTRLAPLTKIIPKPLIPINDKPIVEHIMDKFEDDGFSNFILSLNYKADMIKNYFSEGNKYNIDFIQESDFFGTAGSLSLIKNRVSESFFVSNCDVIVDVEFDEVMEYHKQSSYDITIISIVKKTKIPYGVMKVKDDILYDIDEKPEFTHIINGGIYILEPHVLNLVENNEYLDMPDLIKKVMKKNKVGLYPVTKDWYDVGEFEEYKKVIEKYKIF